MSTAHVLAYYSIRSKQEYIYRTNRIREIAGASLLIAEAFGLLTGAEDILTPAGDAPFSLSRARDRLETGEAAGVVVNEGGGNLIVLYRDRESCLSHNRRFSKALLEQTYSLTPLCALVEVDLDADNYREDYRRLMEEADRIKRQDPPLAPVSHLPFSRMDRTVMQPVSRLAVLPGGPAALTAEAHAKRTRALREAPGEDVELVLDQLVTRTGEESLLAVVYADGNNMGYKVGKALEGKTSYDDCILALRQYSAAIHRNFIDNGLEAVSRRLAALRDACEDDALRRIFRWRPILGGGDEVTFVCNARCALDLARTYLEAVSRNGHSACAGIAVFQRTYPFALAYAMAEQACENAKRAVKALRPEKAAAPVEIAALDFQFIHGGADTDLERVRAEHGRRMARPYLVRACDGSGEAAQRIVPLERLLALAAAFSPARVSVKEMGESVSADRTQAILSLERIVSHFPGMKAALLEAATGERPASEALNARFREAYDRLFPLFYDLAEFYDIWFRAEKEAAPCR